MKSFITMLKTELKLSLRGMDMFIFAICMPIVVLVAIGIIYGNKPAFEGANYTFLIWGILHGIFIVLERLFMGKLLEKNKFKFLNWIFLSSNFFLIKPTA